MLTSGAANATTTLQTETEGSPNPTVTVVDAEEAGPDADALRQQNGGPVLQIAIDNMNELTSSPNSTGVAFDGYISERATNVPVAVTAGEPIDVIPQDNGTALTRRGPLESLVALGGFRVPSRRSGS